MDQAYEQKYLTLEDRHWWHASRRDMVLRLVEDRPRGTRILDVGCSGGAMMAALAGRGFTSVAGVDINADAVARCAGKGLGDVSVMDAQDLRFDAGAFDLLLASDVLEHVPDPDRALQSWRRALKPGGRLIVFVPAHAFLWSDHDVINHHQKRYEKKDLLAILRRNGFEVERCSGWDVVLLLPAAVMAFFRRGRTPAGGSDKAGWLHAAPGWLNRLLTAWLCAENAWLQARNVPTGISYFAVARKT